jgi:hypothetical protein
VSRAFTWGVILAAVAVLALIGVIFTLPQYFQGVLGTDAMGSGVRLLPLIGGLVCGSLPAATLARALGAKAVVAGGFVVLCGALVLGSTTSAASGDGSTALWTALLGVGMGLTMATATSAALAELPAERGAIGSAVLQALNKTAAPLGTAILGSVLSAGYLARLHLAGLSAAAAGTVRESVFGGVAIARRSGSVVLLHAVRAAFVSGMDHALLVCAGVALAGAIMALVFLPSASAVGDPVPQIGVGDAG